ncbi:thrombospondin type 3 repeat-containing protein, partial [Candidatus Nitrosarchaeum limnium]
MKQYIILGILTLIISTIGVFQSNAYGVQDNDHDGVPNDLDQCPHLKEDYLGVVDGCPSKFVPWYDVDSDGIPDDIDVCPTVRETFNKFQDDDGCPDISSYASKETADTDNDGIADFIDSCPTQPETFNGYQDTDGCPDKFTSTLDTDGDGIPDVVDACP